MARRFVGRESLREVGGLGAAAALAALGAYALVMLGTREYGAVSFAPVSVVWSWWMVTAAVVTFPMQHWVIRIGTAHESLRGGLMRSLSGAVALGVVAACISWFARSELFSTTSATYPLLVALMPVGGWCVGASRGVMALRRRFDLVAVSIASENIIRLSVGGFVVLIGGSAAWFAMALPVGFVVAALVFASQAASPDPHVESVPLLDRSSATLGGLVAASLMNQVIQSGTPLTVLTVGGTESDLTTVFVLLLLARIPYFFTNMIAIRFTEHLTSLYLHERRRELARVIRSTMSIGAAVMAIAFVVGATLGPTFVRRAFGGGLVVDPLSVGLFASAGVATVCVLILTLVLVAEDRVWFALYAGFLGTSLGAIALVLDPGKPVQTVAIGFFTAMFLAMVGTAGWSARSLPRVSAAAGRQPNTPSGRGSARRW